MRSLLPPFACVGVLFASAALPAFAFSASFRWCGGPSPAISIQGAPKGTAKISWMMRDANAPAYNHGSGEVAYGGKGGIACGALSNYEGPSPPPGQQHLYRIYLKALDASGAQLAGATAERKFPER